MSDSFVNDFITAQHELNRDMSAALARIEMKLDTQHERIFGANGVQGALPYMHEEKEKLKTRVADLEGWKRGTLKWLAGAVAVLTLEGSALAVYVKYATDAAKVIKGLTGGGH